MQANSVDEVYFIIVQRKGGIVVRLVDYEIR